MKRTPLYIKYFSADQNAGDLASPYLISAISGRDVTALPLREPSPHQHYMGVGSTLAHSDERTVVWGTGIMKPTFAPRGRPLNILGVRGPLTASRLSDLGYGENLVLGDAGLLLPQFYNPSSSKTYRFGLVPHYVDETEPFCDICRDKGGLIISAQQELEPYLAQLASCELIISSSLHGLIFAHAYQIPAIWIQLSDRVFGEGFKFSDYYAFLGCRADEIPKWRNDQSFDHNFSAATCPKIPAINARGPELLYEDLKMRGHV